jgi:hypothetical protein
MGSEFLCVSFLLEPRREGNPTLLVLVLEGEEGCRGVCGFSNPALLVLVLESRRGGMPGRSWLLEARRREPGRPVFGSKPGGEGCWGGAFVASGAPGVRGFLNTGEEGLRAFLPS